jgi:hypothetical protein
MNADERGFQVHHSVRIARGGAGGIALSQGRQPDHHPCRGVPGDLDVLRVALLLRDAHRRREGIATGIRVHQR